MEIHQVLNWAILNDFPINEELQLNSTFLKPEAVNEVAVCAIVMTEKHFNKV